MACQKCGRQGLCTVCCCVSPDHGLETLDECRLCKHPTRFAGLRAKKKKS